MVSGADGGDIIAFIFSGHGYKYDEGESYALSAYEADPGNPDNEGFFNDTELATIMENSIAERVFFFFDCCNASGMYNELELLNNSDTFFLAAATRDDETSWWDVDKEFRCWTQCFLHYSWNGNSERGSSGSITADFIDIFDDALFWYNYYVGSVNYYNANQTPTKLSDYGNGFCLSIEGITPQ